MIILSSPMPPSSCLRITSLVFTSEGTVALYWWMYHELLQVPPGVQDLLQIWYSGKHLMTEKDNVFHSFVHSQPPSVFLRCIVLGTVHVPWLPQIRASMDEVILATA